MCREAERQSVHRRCNDGLGELFWKISDDMKQPLQLDARDKLGNTPLHLAALRSFGRHIRWLLTIGADPNAVNEEGLTPLHIFAKTNFFLATELINISKELDQLVQIDARDKLGNTPLHHALKYTHKKMVEFPTEKRRDPNSVNEAGSTPLHIIAMTDQFSTLAMAFFKIKKELNQLVQVDARDKLGRTPLQLAVANLLPDMVDILLDNGADLSSSSPRSLRRRRKLHTSPTILVRGFLEQGHARSNPHGSFINKKKSTNE
ncbi:unnamed protein product [Trichogramma brassicae]|uniref:Uncharacterized protein n=1 Tax=Trichogramma brassicae TaxID=86971 RepID=A0A6H5HZ36_9HYME|nr:unnamed protein product [Trichogramma brassicae]